MQKFGFRKTWPLVLILLVLPLAFLGAQEDAKTEESPSISNSFNGSALDISIVHQGQRQLEDRPWQTYLVADHLVLLCQTRLSEAEAARIRPALQAILHWQHIGVREVRLELGEEQDLLVVVPNSVLWNDREYAGLLPTGLRLVQNASLMYDFRARSDQFLIRVRGILMRERDLLAELELAVSQPSRYLAERDPGWAARELEVVKAELERLQTALAQAQNDLASQMRETDQNNAQKNQNLMEEQEALRQSVAAYINRPFFGMAKGLAPQTLEKVQAYRATNPTADRAAILAEMKRIGQSVSGKEVDIILLLWPPILPAGGK